MKEMVIKIRPQDETGSLKIEVNGLNQLEIEAGLIKAVLELGKRGAVKPEAVVLGILKFKEGE